MFDGTVPNLIINLERSPSQATLDLRCLLYRGGAATRAGTVAEAIAAGSLGEIIQHRIPIVRAFHTIFEDQRIQGASRATILGRVVNLRYFVAFVDNSNSKLDHAHLAELFKAWVSVLHQRQQRGELLKDTVYVHATRVAATLACALNVPISELIHGARLKKPRKMHGAKADSSNLGVVRAFGGDLCDIISCLSLTRIHGPLPLAITLRSTGQTYPQWAGLKSDAHIKAITDPDRAGTISARNTLASRQAASDDTSLERRYALLNLRTSAEFLVFIAITGVNREQATRLTMGDYRFQSFEDRYAVRKYKNRKRGEVEFYIYPEYRPMFECYLAFRKQAFPPNYSDRLFVTVAPRSPGRSNTVLSTYNIKQLLTNAGRPWVTAQMLRNTKGNMLERAAGSINAARSLQNSLEVFTRHYSRPSHQRAAHEMTAYWESINPSRVTARAAGPGDCQKIDEPRRLNFINDAGPQPDCIDPAGCLFCAFNRGIDSLDYAWSLVSYRTLKRLELVMYKKAFPVESVNPAFMALEVIADRLAAFANKSEANRAWVQESEARIADEMWHPHWEKWIEMVRI